MAKCKVCKTNIPDGSEYCNNCQGKEELISNESYLDSLLNSVKNTAPTADNIYKKKNPSSDNSINPNTVDNAGITLSQAEENNVQDDMSYPLDYDDINDFDQYSIDDDIFDEENEIFGDEDIFGNEDHFGDEDLFGDDLTKLLSVDDNLKEQKIAEPILFDDLNQLEQTSQEKQEFLEEEKEEYQSLEPNSEEAVTLELKPLDVGQEDKMDNESEASVLKSSQISPEEFTEFEAEDDFDPDLNDLLNSLEQFDIGSSEQSQPEGEELDTSYQQYSPSDREEFEQMDTEDDDFLALLNQISSDDPVEEDVKAINSLLGQTSAKAQDKSGMPSDVGDVFSDALKVVSSLNDDNINEADLLNNIPDTKEKKKKQKKEKKSTKKQKEDIASEDKPKVSWLKRLFGNVKDEKTAKLEQEKKEQDEEKSSSKKVKKAKKAKKSKGKNEIAASNEDEFLENDNSRQKETKSKENKAKKEKIKKQKEIIQVIDEIEESEGRINRLGAFIVFIFFGLLALLLYVGSNVVSYTLSIQNATNYFDKQKYTQAYNEVYGIEIKDEDIEIYDKIMTVMFVNKQLNSYNNYYTIGKYPEALDSLLKGLKRYDKYIELATMLGIETDMNYVREQILAELENVFKLSEKDAININSFKSMSEYSMEVYDVVFENMSN